MPEDRISQIRERYRETQKAGTPDIETPDIETPDIKTPVTQDTNRISLIRERYQQMGMDSRPDNDQGSRPDNDQGWITNLSTGVEAGYDQMRGGLKYFGGEVVDWFDGEQPGTGDRWKREAASILENAPQGDSFWYDFGSFLPQAIGSLAAILATPFTGGTSLAAIPAIIGTANIATIAGMAVGSSLHEYDQYTEEMGLETSEMVRLGTGLLNGAIEYAAEKIRLGRFLPKGGLVKKMTAKMVAKNPSLSKNILHKFAQQSPTGYRKYIKAGAYMLNQGKEDGLEELVTETAQSFVNMAYKGEDAWDDFGERAWKSFRGGAMMGVGIGTAGVWATNKTNTTRRKKHGVTLAEYVREKESMMDFVKAPDGSRPLESGVVEIAGTTKNGNYIGITPKGKQIELLPDQISKSITMSNDDFEAYNNALGENHAKAKEILDDVYVKDMTARIDGTVNEMEYFGGQDNAGNGKYFAASDEKGQAIGFVISGGLDTQTDGLSYLIVSDGQGGVKKDQIKSSKIHTIEEISRESIVNYLMTNAGIEKQNMDAQQKAQEAVEDEEVLTNDRVKTKHGNGVVTKMSEVGAVVQLDNGEEKIIPVEELEILRDGIDAEEESVIMKQGRPTDKGVEATSDRKINNEPSQTVQISAKKSVNIYPNEDGTQTIGEGYKDIDEAKAVVNALKKARPNLDKNGFEIINLNQGGDEWAAPEYVIRYSPKTLKDVQVKPTSELEDNRKTGSKESAIGDTRADDGKAGGEDVKTGELKTEVTPGDGVSAIQTGSEKPATGGESNRAGEEIKSNSREQIKGKVEKTLDEQLPELSRKKKGKSKAETGEVTQPTTQSVKSGVPELFESNPEFANAVYEALGYTQKNNTEAKKADINRRRQEELENNEVVAEVKIGNIGKERMAYAITVSSEVDVASDEMEAFRTISDTEEAVDNYKKKRSNIAGVVNTTKVDESFMKNAYEIGFTNVFNSQRGRGIGGKAIISIGENLSNNGYILLSDDSRSEDAEKMWARLEKKGLAKKIPSQIQVKFGDIHIEGLPKEARYVYQYIPINAKYDAELKALETQITPQQKQQAIQKFQEYVNSTGKQDIEGFKKFVTQPTPIKEVKEQAKNAEKGQPLNSTWEERQALREKAKKNLVIDDLFNALPEKIRNSLQNRTSDFFYKGESWKNVIEKSAVNPDMWVNTKDTQQIPESGYVFDANTVTDYYLVGADNQRNYSRKIPKEYYDYFNQIKERYNQLIDNNGENPTVKESLPVEKPVSEDKKVVAPIKPQGVKDTPKPQEKQRPAGEVLSELTDKKIPEVSGKDNKISTESAAKVDTPELSKKAQKMLNELQQGKPFNEVSEENELTEKEQIQLAKLFAESDKFPSKQYAKKDKIDIGFESQSNYDVKPIEKKITPIKDNSTASKISSLKSIVAGDDRFPIMKGVFKDAENNKLVASDTYVLIVIEDKTIKKSEVINPKTGEFIADGADYPNYDAVIPRDNPLKRTVNVNEWLAQLNGLVNTKRFFSNPLGVRIIIGDNTYYFNSEIMQSVFQVFAEHGVENVELQFSDPTRALVVESNKGIMGLVMPFMEDDDSKASGLFGYKTMAEWEYMSKTTKGVEVPTEKKVGEISESVERKIGGVKYKADITKEGAIRELRKRKNDNAVHVDIFSANNKFTAHVYDNNRSIVSKEFKTAEEAVEFVNDYFKSGKIKKGQYNYATLLDASVILGQDQIWGNAPIEEIAKVTTEGGVSKTTTLEEKKITRATGIKPKNLRDTYKAGREVFGLNRSQALAQAIVVNTVVNKIAKNRGVTAEKVWGEIEFRKGDIGGLSKDANALYQAIGKNANLSFWAKRDLVTARKMETKGKTPNQIKLSTGWERGADGKWRYEIPDDVKFDKTWNELGVRITIGLSEAIDAPQLFKLYPELKDVKISKDSPWLDFWKGTQGWFNPEKNELVITPYAQDPMGTLLHEIQHWIQKKEGFAKGGNLESSLNALSDVELKEIAKKVVEDKEKKLIPLREEVAELTKLSKLSEENIAELTELSKEFMKVREETDVMYKEFKATGSSVNPYSTQPFREQQKKENDIKARAKEMLTLMLGETPSSNNVINAIFFAKLPLEKQLKNKNSDRMELLDSISAIKTATTKESLANLLKKDGADYAYDAYKRLSGETEARNISKRKDMSSSERAKSLLSETEDVGRDEQIVLFQKQGTGKTAKGAIQFLADGNAIISALTNPNVSTPLHEIAHLYERYMPDSERKAVLKWAKHKTWSTETSEMFARGFEKYLATGKAPLPSLDGVFRRFKAWLTDIYNGITGSEIDIQLNDAMTDIYSAMLGADVVQKTTKNKNKVEKPVDDLLFQIAGESGAANLDKAERKQKQLGIVLKMNPISDNIHTGIRTINDIKTAEEVFSESINDNEDATPDFTVDDMKAALESGRITVYSSKPIKNGVFISPSYMEAESYSGNKKVYSKEVSVNDVAWIDQFEGQLTEIDKAEAATTRLDNLGVAKKMESKFLVEQEKRETDAGLKHTWEISNEDALKIRMGTGWEKGSDGEWRYEIPDGTLNEKGYRLLKEGGENTLGYMWDDPELFISYPELKKVRLEFGADINERGSFNGGNAIQKPTIRISRYVSGIKEAESVLLHEIQHAIQEIEGFARGGDANFGDQLRVALEKNQRDFWDGKITYQEKYKRDVEIQQSLNPRKIFERYQQLAGEVESRNVQNRINMSEEDRRGTPLKETEDTPRKDQIIYEGDDVKFMANQTGDPNFDSRHEPIIKGAYENALEIFHDNMRSVKTLQELITKRGGVMGEDLNTHLFENLTSSISKAEIENFEHSIQRRFLGAVKHIAGRYGIDADGIGMYLMAKHTSERNKVMQMQGFKLEEGSGMSNVEAEAYISEFEGKVDQAYIKEILDSRSEVTGFTLRTLNKKGLITNDQYRKYKNQYTDYVPLRGWAGETASDIYKYIEDDINRDAPPMKHAKGRTSLADNPLPYMLSMAHAAIIMGNKNVMKTKALNMVRANSQMQDLFSENPIYEVKQDDGTTITTVNRPDQELFDQKKVTVIKDTRNLYKNTIHNASQHDVIVYDNGEKKVISFTDPVVARSINGENMVAKDFVSKILSPTVGRVQRFISANFTSKNPAFVPVNWMRDFGYAYFSHFVKGDKGDAEYFRKSMMNSFKAVSRHLRHNLGTTFSEQAINDAQIKISNGESLTDADYDALYYSFKMNGGETGYVHLKNIKNFKNDIEKELRLAVGNPTRWEAANNYAPIKKAGEWMEYMAQMSENQARFSTYLVSMSKGKSHAQSASDAKNITVNFNRRGKVSGLMGNLYVFFNANVQGVANIGKLAKDHPKAFAKLGAGFMTMGFLSALLTRMWADDDDDENAFDKIPTYIKYNFWVLPNPAYYLGYGEKKEKFLTIPLPHGFRAVYALGVMAYEAATGTKGAGDIAIDLVTNTADSFSPITSLNPDEMLKGDITLRPIVPSWMMPFYDINVNRDFAGRMVYKEPFTKSLEKKIPGSEQSLPNVNPLLKSAARGLNRLGGGDLKRTAAIGFNPKTTKVDAERNEWKWLIYDWNPSKVEHLLEYYLGGKGKFFNNIYKTTRDATLSVINKENQMNEYTTPILRRFIYTPYTKDTPDKYWELKNEISTWKGLYNDAKSDKDIEMMGRFQKNRRMMELINEFDRSEKRIKDMNERIDRSINPEMKKKLIKDRRMIIKDFLNKSKEIDKRHENSNR